MLFHSASAGALEGLVAATADRCGVAGSWQEESPLPTLPVLFFLLPAQTSSALLPILPLVFSFFPFCDDEATQLSSLREQHFILPPRLGWLALPSLLGIDFPVHLS